MANQCFFSQKLEENGYLNILGGRVFLIKCFCHVTDDVLIIGRWKSIFGQNLIYHTLVERNFHVEQLLTKNFSIKMNVHEQFSLVSSNHGEISARFAVMKFFKIIIILFLQCFPLSCEIKSPQGFSRVEISTWIENFHIISPLVFKTNTSFSHIK